MQSEAHSGKPSGPRPHLNQGKETQVQVVQACIKISTACQDNLTRNSARREKNRQTKCQDYKLQTNANGISRHFINFIKLANSVTQPLEQFEYQSVIQSASSLSFTSDLVRGVHARARVERRSRETRERRVAASPVSRLQSRAWSFACLGRFARLTKKEDRLLEVYRWSRLLRFSGFVQILDPKFKIFSRLKVIKQVINRDLKNAGTKLFS